MGFNIPNFPADYRINNSPTDAKLYHRIIYNIYGLSVLSTDEQLYYTILIYFYLLQCHNTPYKHKWSGKDLIDYIIVYDLQLLQCINYINSLIHINIQTNQYQQRYSVLQRHPSDETRP